MRQLLCILFYVSMGIFACAQPVKDSAVTTVKRFFEGMKNADTALLKSTLASNAILQTIRNEGGKTSVANEKISEFVGFVSQLTAGDADEQITIDGVKIDGPLATVWTPYKFFYKGKFSHCGVNSFQLVNIGGEWKIQYIIDTRRKENCQ